MKKIFLLLLLSFAMLNSAEIFMKSSSNVGVSVGAASSYGQDYVLVGISGSYFVVDNLSMDLYYRGWFNATPTQHELSLGANYYLPLSRKFRPYGGVFTRQTVVSGRSNYGTLGVRGGVALINTKNTYASFGYAYEQYLNCPRGMECTNSYPEILFGVSF